MTYRDLLSLCLYSRTYSAVGSKALAESVEVYWPTTAVGRKELVVVLNQQDRRWWSDLSEMQRMSLLDHYTWTAINPRSALELLAHAADDRSEPQSFLVGR